ncbi:MAG: hypothetical protein ACFCBU_12125 [Cyanophyceae cyanobacterium]
MADIKGVAVVSADSIKARGKLVAALSNNAHTDYLLVAIALK